MTNKKYCPICKKHKIRTEFYKCRQRYDGLRAYCKQCEMQKNNDYFKKRYNSDPEFREKIKISVRKSENKFSEKRNVRNIFNNYMVKNNINRGLCELCGKKAEGHHFDYNKPLEVVWVCRTHHKKIHTGKLDQSCLTRVNISI